MIEILAAGLHSLVWPHIVLTSVLLVSVILCTLVRKEWSSNLHCVPGPWYASWTDLHLRYYFARGTIWKYVERQHLKYGPIIWLGPRHVWIADKAAIKDILLTTYLPKVAMYAEISRDKKAPGLFGEIRPEPHKKLKKFLSPAFTVTYIDGLEYLFRDCIQALIHSYDCRKDRDLFETDLMEDLHNVALDVMGKVSFGKGFGQTDPTAEPLEGVARRVWQNIPRSIFTHIAKRYQTVYVKRLLRKLGIDLNFDWSKDMIMAIGASVKTRRSNTITNRPDLLQHVVIEGKRPDNDVKMNDREIIDQMAEILLAGAETTSETLACLFIHLARHPDVKSKLLSSLPRLENDQAMIRGPEIRDDPAYEYFNACIAECLRMNPIASEMGRRTGKDWYEICGYRFPPHTVISASYRHLHLNPEFWPEPNRFWPERWLPAEHRGDAPAADMKAYYPFSSGKHSCIGMNFAWIEMRVVASNILARYDVEEIPGQVVDWRQFITLQLWNDHWRVTLKRRTV